MPREEESLRPIESVILRMQEEGLGSPEIGKRIGKKPGTVDRILEMIEYKDGIETTGRASDSESTPIERVIKRLRSEGETYGEIGNRLGRSGDTVRRIEEMADMRGQETG